MFKFYCGFLTILCCCFICCIAHGQEIKPSQRKKILIEPTTDFDQRFSFIKKQSVNIWGQKIGILINKKHKFGVGGYFLNDQLKRRKLEGQLTTEYTKRNLTFFTLYYEPYVYRSKFIDVTIPFEIGFGKATYKNFAISNDAFIDSRKRDFIPVGAGISVFYNPPAFFNFKPFRWIGYNANVGYRYCMFQNIFKANFDGWYYSLGGAIFLNIIYEDYKLFKKKKLERN